MPNGTFVISLDFELMWGVRDKLTIEKYGEHIRGVRNVIPRLLETFRKHDVKGTFSTVGFLFFETKQELLSNLPPIKPCYTNKKLSPYEDYLDQVGENEQKDLYHFAASLIRQIQQYPEQEIGTHTFSHYYCLENGQTLSQFKADIEAAIIAAKAFNIEVKSLVFPRNQYNEEYLKVCSELGVTCYRGNERSWLYSAKNGEEETLLRRAFRLVDAYINISGHHCYSDAGLRNVFPVDVPSSRFLRPFSPGLKMFEPMRLRRIKKSMTHAAQKKQLYHLWWHPHNFGTNRDQNFAFLDEILTHYDDLKRKYGFESKTMSDYAQTLMYG